MNEIEKENAKGNSIDIAKLSTNPTHIPTTSYSSFRKGLDQEAEDFLERVDEVTKTINDILSGKIDSEQWERQLEEKKKREELDKLTKERLNREREEKAKQDLLMGRKGKGEGDYYNFFCRYCFREYLLLFMTNCSLCSRPVETREARKNYLQGKLAEMKVSKANKSKRKANFAQWIKTEQLVTNRTFRNYQKWDLYESDTDEDEKGEPILPRDDPKFQALEMDLKNQVKKREEDNKLCEKYKNEGNEFMKAAEYRKAVEKYSLALDACRAFKALYTNRSNAYLKLEEYQLAIKDCDKVLDYYTAFEEELTLQPDIYCKALLRKCLGLKGLKKFDSALEQLELIREVEKNDFDKKIKQSLLKELFPALTNEINKLEFDINAEKEFFANLKKEINLAETSKPLFKELNNLLNIIEEYNRKKSLNESAPSLAELSSFKILISKLSLYMKTSSDFCFYFISSNGVDLILNFIYYYNSNTPIQSYEEEHSTLLLDFFFSLVDNDFKKAENEKMTSALNSLKLFTRLIKMIINKPDLKRFAVPTLKSIFGVLERGSMVECVRKSMGCIPKVELLIERVYLNFYFDNTIKDKEENDDKKQVQVDINSRAYGMLINFFTFMSNLMFTTGDLRGRVVKYSMYCKVNGDFIIVGLCNTISTIINELNQSLIKSDIHELKTVPSQKNKVFFTETIISFIINLSNDLDFRRKFITETNSLALLKQMIILINTKKIYGAFAYFSDLLERILSLFINLNFEETLTEFFLKEALDLNLLFEYLKKQGCEDHLVHLDRGLVVFAKMIKKDYSVLISNSFGSVKFMMMRLIELPLKQIASLSNLIKCCSIALSVYVKHILTEIKDKALLELLFKTKLRIWEVIVQEAPSDCDDKEVVVNALSYMISYYSIFTVFEYFPTPFTEKEEHLKLLINFTGEKLGLTRKNSGVLLAKIMKSSTENDNLVRKHHGMEVLMSEHDKLGIK